MQVSRAESYDSYDTYDTQDTLRDESSLKHVVTMDLSRGDENVSDGMAGRESLALNIEPKYNMRIVPLPSWNEMPIPRSSSRTIPVEKYWTNRRKMLAFLIVACLIVVMVSTLVFVGREEWGDDRNGNPKQVNNAENAVTDPDSSFVAPTDDAGDTVTTEPTDPDFFPVAPPAGAEDTVTTAPSDPDVFLVAPPAAPIPTAAPNNLLKTTLAYQVLEPKVEDPTLLLIPDTAQGKALQMIVDEHFTYDWTPFRIAQRYALMVLYLSSDGDTWNWNSGWHGFGGDECAWYGIVSCRMQPHGERAVVTVALDANNLVGSIPSEICLLNLVQNIDLGENAFQGKIPGCIAYMPSLNRFYADNNQLSGSLPTGPWPALESLTLSDNKFSGDLSTVSSMLSLRNLDVHSNQFTGHLPENLFLKSVEKLDFSKNQLSGSLNVLFLGLYANGSFEAASTLRVLHLNDNLFHGGQLGLFFFLGQLEQLTLEGNLLTGDLDGECQRSLDILTADCDHVNCACCTACN